MSNKTPAPPELDTYSWSDGFEAKVWYEQKFIVTSKRYKTVAEAIEDAKRQFESIFATQGSTPSQIDGWWQWALKHGNKMVKGVVTQGQDGSTITSYHCDHAPDERSKKGQFVNSPYSIGDVAIIGATKSKINALPAAEASKRLIINCSGFSLASPVVVKPSNPVESKIAAPSVLIGHFLAENWALPPAPPKNFGDEIILTWPDHGPAQVKAEFWAALLETIQHPDFPYTSVIFCCVGGHGRTGTALASLAIAAGIYDESPVTWYKSGTKKVDPKHAPATIAERCEVYIQRDYCSSAIESDAQSLYLAYVEATLRGTV